MMCWLLRRAIGGSETLHDVNRLDREQYGDTPGL